MLAGKEVALESVGVAGVVARMQLGRGQGVAAEK